MRLHVRERACARVRARARMRACASMRVCVRVRARVCTHECVCVCAHTCMHAQVCVSLHAHMHVCTLRTVGYTCTHIQYGTWVRTHTHTHNTARMYVRIFHKGACVYEWYHVCAHSLAQPLIHGSAHAQGGSVTGEQRSV